MASIGLIIGTTIIVKIADKKVYAMTTLIPLVYLLITVTFADIWGMVANVYANPDSPGFSVLNTVLSVPMGLLAIVITISAVKKWIEQLNSPLWENQKRSA
jgi:carbon starvation protein